MRYSLISIIIFVFTSSCGLPLTKGLLEQTPKKEIISTDYFSNTERDYIYKARLKILTHHFGGILIIKKINKDHYRVVFTTEFGNKLFDFELINDDLEVNYILDEINKKFILKMLELDFQTLLYQNNKVDNQFSGEGEDIFQSNKEKHQNYYVFSKNTGELLKIVSASKNKEKLIISFPVTDRGIATSIILKHKKFKAEMELYYIGKLD